MEIFNVLKFMFFSYLRIIFMFDRFFTIAFFVLVPFQLLGNNEPYLLDFTQIQGNALDWFEERGWEEQVDMDKMNPRFEDGSLVIEVKDAYSGVFFKDFRPESKRLSGINRIRIKWGVEQYPEGADWSGPVEEKRNVRNSIGVMVFLEMKIRKADRFSYLTSPIF